jgi:1,2-diacylglycerol 3-alpha-glucosyltransferase
MRIVMMTNNYLPFVGGSALSVHRFSEKLRELGHQVLIIAPKYDEEPEGESEDQVHRVAAWKNFNQTGFSLPLPLHIDLLPRIAEFAPDIIHTHHPFLLGDTALRIAASLNVPLVSTHHTQYAHYIHYLTDQAEWMERFVQELSTGHANLCDANIAPSEDIRKEMVEFGVTSPIEVIPTGVDLDAFETGDRARGREALGIAPDVPVLGHVGRIAPEKNLNFLLDAAILALEKHREALFVIVGDGPSLEELRERAGRSSVTDRVIFAGRKTGQDVVDAYHAIDVFLFASQSETQGMVILEAMAANSPVVAVDAPGVRDVVKDGENGRLLAKEDLEAFARAVLEVLEDPAAYGAGLQQTVDTFSLDATTAQLVKLYNRLVTQGRRGQESLDDSALGDVQRRLQAEWDLWLNRADSVVEAIKPEGADEA